MFFGEILLETLEQQLQCLLEDMAWTLQLLHNRLLCLLGKKTNSLVDMFGGGCLTSSTGAERGMVPPIKKWRVSDRKWRVSSSEVRQKLLESHLCAFYSAFIVCVRVPSLYWKYWIVKSVFKTLKKYLISPKCRQKYGNSSFNYLVIKILFFTIDDSSLNKIFEKWS